MILDELLKVVGGALSASPTGGKSTKDLGPPPPPLPAMTMRTPPNAVSPRGPWIQSGYAVTTKDSPNIFGTEK